VGGIMELYLHPRQTSAHRQRHGRTDHTGLTTGHRTAQPHFRLP
jgi:hypothetical protein